MLCCPKRVLRLAFLTVFMNVDPYRNVPLLDVDFFLGRIYLIPERVSLMTELPVENVKLPHRPPQIYDQVAST
jgi:hypothetical protein